MARRFSLTLLLLGTLLPPAAHAVQPGSACLAAAATAEGSWRLPTGLIGAVGRVESGRFDTASGRLAPWPWTVNANGSGYFFASSAEAVRFVRQLQSRGVRLIDVGCFQIDLFYHPTAFASLETAFDPAANADYAGKFLTTLRSQTGSWPTAIALYHSGQALEGATYRQKVLSQWRTDGSSQWRTDGSSQWRSGATLTEAADTPPASESTLRGTAPPDRYVVLMSPANRAIHVFGPSVLSSGHTSTSNGLNSFVP